MSSLLKLSALAVISCALCSCGPKSDATAPTAEAGNHAAPGGPAPVSTQLPNTAPAPSVSMPPETLIGSWTAEDPSSKGNNAKIDFKKNGTFTLVVTLPLANSSSTGDITIGGTYSVKNYTITEHYTSMVVSSSAKEPEVQNKIREANKSTLESLKTAKDIVGKLQWRDKDNVRVMMNAPNTGPAAGPPVLTLKRKTS